MGVEEQLKKFVYSPDDARWTNLDLNEEMEQTIWTSIRERREARNRKLRQSLVAACCLLLAFVTIKLTGLWAEPSTAVLPAAYGSIFAAVGDQRFQDIAKKGLTSKVDLQKTDMGVAVTISEVYYDRGMLAFSYAVQFPEEKDRGLTMKERTPEFEVKINGQNKRLQWDDGFNDQWNAKVVKEIQPRLYAGIVTLRPMDELPDEFTLELDIPRVGIIGSSGKWKYAIPVKLQDQVKRELRTLRPNQVIDWYGNEVTIKEIRMMPSMLQVEVYQHLNPNRKVEGITGQLADGKRLQGGVRYIQSYDYKTSDLTLIFPPVHQMADSIRLTLWIDEPDVPGERKKKSYEVKDVPFRLSDMNKQVEITDFAQRGGEAKIYYKTKDTDGIPRTLTLEDTSGEEYFVLATEGYQKSGDAYKIALIFPVPTGRTIQRLNEYYYDTKQGERIDSGENRKKEISIPLQ
ncbi:DUF4179 domain-containing protein [Brevibacillus brevis]|uniref:DUF4179 domain-containing protein n=1 Tax=Brevibacillus brevis TaxID=1393 RepID=A0ABY9T9Q2_BREBE|nr:DUF4179 domain-containing protein [Brevibacillus brevis]WNC16609.1 DUF4179 domain-containing protein [Brevibacillus brevis]